MSFRQTPSVPLIIAANRDELRDRPASGVQLWENEPFLAPRDQRAGGAWLGLTAGGLFVGVTNRYPSEKFEGRDSRGQLVVEALRAPSAAALHEQLSSLSPARFNTFHLLYADADHCFVTWSDGAALHQEQLGPGLHVVTERSLGGDDHQRLELITRAWPGLARVDGVPTAAALQGLLASRRPDDPTGSVCVDVPAFNYGTRSSFVLLRAERLSDSQLITADGPPDTTPFVDHSALLAQLLERG